MSTIENIYLGKLRTEATHLRSGNKVTTDAPLDNQGLGEAFSPTDLLAASLSSCMLTIMGIKANLLGINLEGTKVNVNKIMGSDPRRVIRLEVQIKFPKAEYEPEHLEILKEAAINCPVAKSLNQDLEQAVDFNI